MAEAKRQSNAEQAEDQQLAGTAPQSPEIAAGTEPESTAPEEGELAALRTECAELKDRLLRAIAEADNARKRAERDRREAEAYGSTRLARDMLPVYDNLRRALDASGSEPDAAARAVIEGVELTLRELSNALARHGIERISPQIGDAFDPQLHQAMFEAPVPSVPAGHLIQVGAEGFLIHGRLLRPAQVGVSSFRGTVATDPAQGDNDSAAQ
ncbi:MAG: nucleotide exchange factor GrpE [Alphaproteobacteria bacterium HGW-Alphaproteobacteria-2]|nr:MAG: nucleotide exchange factor GrpE [Alphaproteobacteria bacterium HGW-Alphaproteobacteria-2]